MYSSLVVLGQKRVSRNLSTEVKAPLPLFADHHSRPARQPDVAAEAADGAGAGPRPAAVRPDGGHPPERPHAGKKLIILNKCQ